MTLNLPAIRTAGAALVAAGVTPPTDRTLTTSGYIPIRQPASYPFFYIAVRRISPGKTNNDQATILTLDGILLAAPVTQGYVETAQDVLDYFLTPNPPASIRAALMADGQWDSTVSRSLVGDWVDYGIIRVGGIDHIGARLEIRAYVI